MLPGDLTFTEFGGFDLVNELVFDRAGLDATGSTGIDGTEVIEYTDGARTIYLDPQGRVRRVVHASADEERTLDAVDFDVATTFAAPPADEVSSTFATDRTTRTRDSSCGFA